MKPVQPSSASQTDGASKTLQKNEEFLLDQKMDESNAQDQAKSPAQEGLPDTPNNDQKRTLAELLAEYEKRRIDFEKFQQNDMSEGGDPLMYQAMQRAIKRMSYDYRAKEKKLKERHKKSKNAAEKFNQK